MSQGNAVISEQWLPVLGYEGRYDISNLGKVRSLHHKSVKYLKPSVSNTGYERVALWNGRITKFSVHRLVATHFIPNPLSKEEVNHIDGNKTNNNADNLEWVSRSENQNHAIRTGLQPVIFNDPSHIKAVDMISQDGKVITTFHSAAEAERITGICHAHISKCCNGKRTTAGGFRWKFHDTNVKNARCK